MGFRNPVQTAEDPVARAAAGTAQSTANQALGEALYGVIPGSRLAADAIDGRTITGATIRTTASSTGNRMLLDATNGLRGMTGSTVNTQITPGGVLTAKGATITGTTKTADTGARVEISSGTKWGSAVALIGTDNDPDAASGLTRGSQSWGPYTLLEAGTDQYGQGQGSLFFGFASGAINPNGSRKDGNLAELTSDVIVLTGTADMSINTPHARRVQVESPLQITYIGDVDAAAGLAGGGWRPSLMIGTPTGLNCQIDNNEGGFFNNGTKTGTFATQEWVAQVGTTFTGTAAFTAAAGWAIETASFVKVVGANLAIANCVLTRTGAAIGTAGGGDLANATVATIRAGFEPLLVVPAVSGSGGRVAHGEITSAGEVRLTAVADAGTNISVGNVIQLAVPLYRL